MVDRLVLAAALAAVGFYLAVRGYIDTANGETNDIGTQGALLFTTFVLVLAGFAVGAWRLWPRHKPRI